MTKTTDNGIVTPETPKPFVVRTAGYISSTGQQLVEHIPALGEPPPNYPRFYGTAQARIPHQTAPDGAFEVEFQFPFPPEIKTLEEAFGAFDDIANRYGREKVAPQVLAEIRQREAMANGLTKGGIQLATDMPSLPAGKKHPMNRLRGL